MGSNYRLLLYSSLLLLLHFFSVARLGSHFPQSDQRRFSASPALWGHPLYVLVFVNAFENGCEGDYNRRISSVSSQFGL
jgi:hypothetical protein